MKDQYDFSKGRRGPVIPSDGKMRITIWLDNDIIEAFKAQASDQGTGYQTAINAALRRAMSDSAVPVTEDALRRILREELQHA